MSDFHTQRQALPWINFPSHWQVKIIPPAPHAVIRFLVRLGPAEVSVYADFTDQLGSVGQPYWEIYPNAADETSRFYLNEVSALLTAIEHSLHSQLRNA